MDSIRQAQEKTNSLINKLLELWTKNNSSGGTNAANTSEVATVSDNLRNSLEKLNDGYQTLIDIKSKGSGEDSSANFI